MPKMVTNNFLNKKLHATNERPQSCNNQRFSFEEKGRMGF
jgi:hypothetical protein